MGNLAEDNPQQALRILLHRLNTKFTDYSIKSLKQHPDYPSLLSINHTLNQLQIDNIAVRGTYEQLQNEFPKPLLVHNHHDGGTYQVVDAIDEDQIHFVNYRGKLEVQPKSDFLKDWSGIVVLIDEETPGKEPNYVVNKTKFLLRQITLPGAVAALLILIGYIFYYTDNITSPFDYLFLSTKALGIAVTVPLMIRLIDKRNPFVKKLCHTEKKGSNINCDSILDAPAATFLGMKSKFMNFVNRLSHHKMKAIIGGYSGPGNQAICNATCRGNGTIECDPQDQPCTNQCMESFDTWCQGYCAAGV